jgi:molybdate transport system substrate-binding protein
MSRGTELRVIVSGALRAAYVDLVEPFELASGLKVESVFGGSMGTAATAIPMRLQNGEIADVVILAAEALDPLIAQGLIRPGSRVDLARSGIGVAIRSGSARPDIGSVDAFKRALLDAQSIACSVSASGVYVTGLFERLGIADALKPKLKQIQGEPVGAVVARGEAQLGFQQKSELLPVPGIDLVGPLPAEIQANAIFSAAVPTSATQLDGAQQLIAFLTSPAAAAIIEKSGMEPLGAKRE